MPLLAGVAFLWTVYLIIKVNKETKKDVPLARDEKIQVIITEIFNPILAGALYYYVWREKFPTKANQANKYSFIIFGLLFLLLIIFVIFVAPKLQTSRY